MSGGGSRGLGVTERARAAHVSDGRGLGVAVPARAVRVCRSRGRGVAKLAGAAWVFESGSTKSGGGVAWQPPIPSFDPELSPEVPV